MKLVMALLFSLFVVSCSNDTVTVNIANKSSQIIENGHVYAYGKKYEIGEIEIGKISIVKFDVQHDESYKVVVRLNSGKEMTSDGRYITPGINYNDNIVVTDQSVELHTEAP